MKRLSILLSFIGLLALVSWIVLRPSPNQSAIALHPGWKVIRPPHDVAALLIEPNEVWAGGTEGVWVADPHSLQAHPAFPADDGPQHVHALLRDVDGALLIAHDGGLTRLTNGRTERVELPTGLLPGVVLSLLITRSGELWVGTDRGAAVRQGNIWQAVHVSDGLANEVVNVMHEDSEGGLWIGSYDAPRGGLSYRPPKGPWQRWSVTEGLPHPNITSLCQEGTSRIWAGGGLFERGGAACFEQSGGVWHLSHVFGKRDGLAGEKVRSIFFDSKKRLWFGSEYDGLAVRLGDMWKIYRETDGLSHPEIKVIREDNAGNLWIGTRDGITRISADAL